MHRAFKRDPAVYQNAIRLLNLEPEQVMMAAAHNDDLAAARNYPPHNKALKSLR